MSSKVKANIRLDEAELLRFNIVQIPLSLVKPNSYVKSESSLNNMSSLMPILCLPFIEEEKRRKTEMMYIINQHIRFPIVYCTGTDGPCNKQVEVYKNYTSIFSDPVLFVYHE